MSASEPVGGRSRATELPCYVISHHRNSHISPTTLLNDSFPSLVYTAIDNTCHDVSNNKVLNNWLIDPAKYWIIDHSEQLIQMFIKIYMFGAMYYQKGLLIFHLQLHLILCSDKSEWWHYVSPLCTLLKAKLGLTTMFSSHHHLL